MAINLRKELERLYQQNQSQGNSLSARLEEIDKYTGEVGPQVRGKMLDFSNRPTGYNPLHDIRSAIEFSESNRDYRSAAADDLGRSQSQGLALLEKLAGYEEEETSKNAEQDAINRILGIGNRSTPNPLSAVQDRANQGVQKQVAGIKQSAKPTAKQQNPVEAVTDFLFGTTKKYLGDIDKKRKEIEAVAKKDPAKAAQMLKDAAGSGNLLADLVTGKGQARNAIKPAMEIGSFAVPFGKGAGLIQKAVAPGAAAGALQAGSEENAGLKDVAMGAGLGAVAGGGVYGAGKLIKGVSGAVGRFAKNKATQGITKATPSQFTNVVEQKGMNVNDLAERYFPQGGDYDTALGTVAERGRGGALGEAMKQAEAQIQQTVKTAGSNVRLSGDDLTKQLLKEAKAIAKELGGDTRAAAMKEIVNQAKKKYARGMSVKTALETVRKANERFGQAVVEDQGGAVATAAQKLEANTLRETLKRMFPDLADALKTQEEVLTLRPILNRARGTANTQGSQIRVGRLNNLTDLLNPGRLAEAAAQNPGLASRAMGIQGKGVSGPGDLLAKIAALGSSGMVRGQQPQQPYTDDGQNTQYGADNNYQSDDMQSQINHSNSISDGVNITPEQMMQILLDPSISSATKKSFQDAFELQQSMGKSQKKTEAQVAREEADYLISDALTQLEANPNIATGPAAQLQEVAAFFNVADEDSLTLNKTIAALQASIAKARAGTSFTPNEQKLLNQYTPKIGDSAQQITVKLKKLQQAFARHRGVQTVPNEVLAPTQ